VGYWLYDLACALAVARGGNGVKTDPMDLPSALSLRERIAAVIWIPAAFGAAAIGSGFESWVAGVAALVLFTAALWFFAERGPQRRVVRPGR
jgi:hypothetical protein